MNDQPLWEQLDLYTKDKEIDLNAEEAVAFIALVVVHQPKNYGIVDVDDEVAELALGVQTLIQMLLRNSPLEGQIEIKGLYKEPFSR